ncbi:type VII secretion protein EccE [Rhodococcus sovatensis]|uniref:Type VII secretion protein EccE n=1 Tax=Rhodococcus sovatensis TaxID=1805840 RepID=A0ABZ2PW63_9NOCA
MAVLLGRHSRHNFGLRLPTLRRALGVEVVAVLICALALATHIPVQTALMVGIPLAVLPFVVFSGRTLLDWAITAFEYATGSVPPTGVTSDYTDPDGTTLGVHRLDSHVSSVLELRPSPGATTRLGRSGATSDCSLDLSMLSHSLVQHDISLSGITVVSYGARTASGSPATDVYEHLIGPLPAVASRTVWVTVTLDVRTNHHAVEARGGGHLGVHRTVSIATQRVARALQAHGVESRILTRHEIRSAASDMCRGVSLDALTENWRSAPLPGAIRTGFGFDCRALDDRALADIWAVPALASSVVMRLSPTATTDHVALSGSCGFVTRTIAPSPALADSVSMRGRQREALLTSLPLAITAPNRGDPVRDIPTAQVAAVRIPTSGCGQLLGSDSSGHGVAVRIHGPDLSSVHVAGELYLAQQLVFRAIATGARILVRTDRPHAWGPLVDSVATPDRLRIEGGGHRTGTRTDLIVHDFSSEVDTPAPFRHDRVTVLTLTELSPRTPMSDPDVSIVQPGAVGDRIRLRTQRSETELVLVTIPQETAFIGRPRSLRQAIGSY